MARGSVRQRGRGRWELRVYAGVDAATGRQRYATRTVHGSRRAAVRALDDLAVEVDNTRSHAGTVADLLQRWFAAASPGWAPTTVAHTRSIIDCHLVPHLGHLDVAKLTTADIDDFYGDLLRCGGRDGTGLAPGTVHRVHSVLHRALVQALRWDWIWINPAAAASPPRVRRAELRPPTPAEVNALLAVVVDRPLVWCLLRLAATTGARRGQLLALQWRDVDLGRGVIAFTRALVVGPDGPVLGATKTDVTHCTDLDAVSAEGLRRCRAAAEQRAAEVGVMLPGAGFVFSDDADGRRPWPPDRATKQFIAARRAAGLPHFRLHDLRHFMATEMLAAGVPLATVSQRLNHARISTTVNVYTHAIPAWDRPAAEKLAELLACDNVPEPVRRC
jgi:integrase